MKRLSITRDRVVTAAVGLRPTLEARDDVRRTVADIIDMVRRGGDDALRRLTSRLDGADLAQSRVKADELARALEEIDPSVREAIELLGSEPANCGDRAAAAAHARWSYPRGRSSPPGTCRCSGPACMSPAAVPHIRPAR